MARWLTFIAESLNLARFKMTVQPFHCKQRACSPMNCRRIWEGFNDPPFRRGIWRRRDMCPTLISGQLDLFEPTRYQVARIVARENPYGYAKFAVAPEFCSVPFKVTCTAGTYNMHLRNQSLTNSR